MATPHLTAITSPSDVHHAAGEVYDLNRGVETSAQRIRRLQEEARALAREQVEALARDLEALAAHASEVADGGEAYPAGIRDFCARIAADAQQKAQALVSIQMRSTQA